jgi:putative endonuclease
MSGFAYIITNRHHTTLYVGVTSDLFGRTKKHRDKIYPKSFSARYNLCKLVYYERFDSITDAIAREKQLKAGSRKKKLDLINKYNPEWKDLSK